MSDLFSHLMEALQPRNTEDNPAQSSASKVRPEDPRQTEATLNVPSNELSALPLSRRTVDLLTRSRVTTIERLTSLSRNELLAVPYLDLPSAAEVLAWLRTWQKAAPTTSTLGSSPALQGTVEPEAKPLAWQESQELTAEESRRIWLQLPISALDLSTRPYKALLGAGIQKVGDLVMVRSKDLKRIRNMGATSVHEIVVKLHKWGLGLPDKPTTRPVAQPPTAASAAGTNAESGRRRPAGDWRDQPVAALNLSSRQHEAVARAGIQTVGELAQISESELFTILTMCNLGKAALDEVQAALRRLRLEDTQPNQTEAVSTTRFDNQAVETLTVSRRASNALRCGGIRSIGELRRLSAADLLRLRNLGRTSLNEIRLALSQLGLQLNDDPVEQPAVPKLEDTPLLAESLNEWLDRLFERLSERERSIISQRRGLGGQAPATLEQVGNHLGITRERVRQIENKAMRHISHQSAQRRLHALGEHYVELLRLLGGVARTSELADAIGQHYQTQEVDPAAFLRFTLPMCKGITEWPGDRWALEDINERQYTWVEITLVDLLSERGVPTPSWELIELLLSRHPQFAQMDRRFIETCLRTSADITIAKGWAFLCRWLSLGHKAAWALAALYDIGRPAHFTDVTRRFRELVPELGPVNDHSMHAILSRSPEVVRTDLGTFGLKIWGVTADRVIVDLLEDAFEHFKVPATYEQLVDYVMERKNCEEKSIRAFLETDSRFWRLRRNLYALARWVVLEVDEDHLTVLRSTPLQPDWIVRVIDRLVQRDGLMEQELMEHLADNRQLGKVHDYIQYLFDYGWAEWGRDRKIMPTILARKLVRIPSEADRTYQFALQDPNFQAYLVLLFIEHLIRLEWDGETQKVQELLEGRLAPLREIYTVMQGRLQRRCPANASKHEKELHLLQSIRAPGVPQVFVRWTEPAIGIHSSEWTTLLNRLIERSGPFPSTPSRVPLSRVPRTDARLLVVALALADELGGAVDFTQLKAFAEKAGVPMGDWRVLASDLVLNGLFVDDRDRSALRLLSPHRIQITPSALPEGIATDPGRLQIILEGTRVIIPGQANRRVLTET